MAANGNVPDFGALRVKPRVQAQGPVAWVRHLDEDGTFEATGGGRAPNGAVQATIKRSDYMAADEFLEAIRLIIRDELRAALVGPNSG